MNKLSNYYAVPVLAAAPVVQFGEGDFSYNGMRGLAGLGSFGAAAGVSEADFNAAINRAIRRGAPADVVAAWREANTNISTAEDLANWIPEIDGWKVGDKALVWAKPKWKVYLPIAAGVASVGVAIWLALR